MNDFSLSDIFSITLNPLQVITSLLIALLVGLFIFFIYKKTFGGVMYSRNFNLEPHHAYDGHLAHAHASSATALRFPWAWSARFPSSASARQ